jgi:hypothetical protein
LVLEKRIIGKCTADVAVARARCTGGQVHRAAKFFRTRGEVERVKTLVESGIIGFALLDDVDRAGERVDHGRAGDADFGNEVGAICIFDGRNGSAALGEQLRMPVTVTGVGIKRVDAIVLGGDVDDIARAEARDVDTRCHERLRVHVPIHAAREQSFEDVGTDIGWCENRFVGVRARAQVVVVVGKHTDLSVGWSR